MLIAQRFGMFFMIFVLGPGNPLVRVNQESSSPRMLMWILGSPCVIF